jgi:hypothetical protein
MLGERIFNLRRHDGVNSSPNHFVALQISQVLGKHLLGHARNELAQLTEPLGTGFQIKQDQRFPFAADDVGGQFYRAIVFLHRTPPASMVTKRCLLAIKIL